MAYESAATRIASALRVEILHGDLAPGSKLAQVGLAERFGVSRIPVRDALQALTGEGLVQPLANATAVVTRMSVQELQELYDLREAIEPMATQIAVPNVGRVDIMAMRKQLAIMAAFPDARTWLAANTEFHAAVYRRANRPRTIELIEQLRRLTDRYIHLHLESVGQTAHIHGEHEAILAAIESGDAALTARLTREHLMTAHDQILTSLVENPAVEGVLPVSSR
ncbi:MAG: hypothetical protein QOD39_5113 [Mycobacterium sp.]|jgi:DNA-binding GntR family transcriptional regulator|nr:hypothetical protein [Mycobacterium sp.]